MIKEVEDALNHPIMEQYKEPHRKYHNVEHIEHMLSYIPMIKDSKLLTSVELEALILMILYHDAVYNIPDPDRTNEELSAKLFEAHYPDPMPYRVAIIDAILATKHHQPSNISSMALRILIDLDLIALADDELRAKNDVKIRDEMRLSGEEDLLTWYKGRMMWLSKFLERPKIFFSPIGRPFEEQTRKALENDLRQIRLDINKERVKREFSNEKFWRKV
tara:strand:+ start:330 stop:986 length:657 start_codon:yes stop_codon:yes gene_type:complete